MQRIRRCPSWSPSTLEQGEKLRVAATTGIVADVVANVGGDAIELTPLLPVGADPHSYTPTPQDLRTLNDAHVIFVNGLGLEESLLPILENLDRPTPLVSVNLGVDTLQLDHEEASGHDDGEDDHARRRGPAHVVQRAQRDGVDGQHRDSSGRAGHCPCEAYLARRLRPIREQLAQLDAELRIAD